MGETGLRGLVEAVRAGRMARRDFIAKVVGLGLTVPMAAALATHAGTAHAQAQGTVGGYKPTRRGGGGALKLLFWQGPTLLNPHFATGSKDMEAARVFYEPLAAYDAEGLLVPILAAEIPSLANGGLAADGRSVTWKLKRGVTWHDGRPFTADDCVFNWLYARDPATAATTVGGFRGFVAERIDDHTVRLVFERPMPFWQGAMALEALVPKHKFEAFMGAKSREAPSNLVPVGTGPYTFVEFKPGDLVRGKLNANYHMASRPHFDTIEIKGGGEATSAARAVLQAGEYDYAWNLQVEDDVLKRIEEGGKGRIILTAVSDVELIQLNMSDPWNEVDGERASAKSKHFAFSDLRVRQAMAMLADRKGIQDYIYGRGGIATANYLNAPARYRSTRTRFEFDVDKASALLESAGWKRGADGIREKDGKKMKFVFQTSSNGIRQKEQAVIKSACQKAGIDLELKVVSASSFFSSDQGNPDTYSKFWSDMQMWTAFSGAPDPEGYMNRFTEGQIASRANKWAGRNYARWRSDEYEALFKSAREELDPVKRAEMFIAMNDLVVRDVAAIPLINRIRVAAAGTKLVPVITGWAYDLAHLYNWYREG